MQLSLAFRLADLLFLKRCPAPQMRNLFWIYLDIHWPTDKLLDICGPLYYRHLFLKRS